MTSLDCKLLVYLGALSMTSGPAHWNLLISLLFTLQIVYLVCLCHKFLIPSANITYISLLMTHGTSINSHM